MVKYKNTLWSVIEDATIHKIPRQNGSIAVRVLPGTEPAYLLLHGFPDNSKIYDLLIPHLVQAGRQAVAIDFLGFGASDKPEGAAYSFEQQLGDVEAVVERLGLQKVIPVGHDAGGPAAINYALKHADRTAAVVVLNAFYGDAPGLLIPEIIDFFSMKRLAPLHKYVLSSPQNFAWFFGFQRTTLMNGLSEPQRERFLSFLQPLIDENFTQQPGAVPAFASMVSQLSDELAANTARLSELRKSQISYQFIWGKLDTYLHVSVAEYMRSQMRNAELHVLDAGHWPQIDSPEETAKLMLELH